MRPFIEGFAAIVDVTYDQRLRCYPNVGRCADDAPNFNRVLAGRCGASLGQQWHVKNPDWGGDARKAMHIGGDIHP